MAKKPLTTEQRLNQLEKRIDKKLAALDWAIEEILPRLDALSERQTITEGRVSHLADTQTFTDAMPTREK